MRTGPHVALDGLGVCDVQADDMQVVQPRAVVAHSGPAVPDAPDEPQVALDSLEVLEADVKGQP